MKKNKRIQKRYLLSIFLISFFFGSCQWVTIEPVDIVVDEVSFTKDIQPVFTEKCATCHSSQAPVLSSGSAYSSLINGGFISTDSPASSKLYVKITGGHPGGNATSPTENASILKWIEDGAQNN